MRYWAFISYSNQDREVAEWLHRSIETYRIPRRFVGRDQGGVAVPRRLYPIFRDRDELPTSSDLGEGLLDRTTQPRIEDSRRIVDTPDRDNR